MVKSCCYWKRTSEVIAVLLWLVVGSNVCFNHWFIHAKYCFLLCEEFLYYTSKCWWFFFKFWSSLMPLIFFPKFLRDVGIRTKLIIIFSSLPLVNFTTEKMYCLEDIKENVTSYGLHSEVFIKMQLVAKNILSSCVRMV